MSTRIVGPFNRVEGDLEVRLDVADGVVQSARVVSPLYRGFEPMLLGRVAEDALVIVPRICGICSVAQSAAAASALRQLTGLVPPENGQLAANLVLACENLADHLSHFYVFFMPDFARDAYRARDWFAQAKRRFKAGEGTASAEVLPARANFMHLMGLLAGKWPHTLCLQPGGTSRPLENAECLQVLTLLRAFRRFLERSVFDDSLESVARLTSSDDLAHWRRGRKGDLALFLTISDDLALHAIGRATDVFLSAGAYAQAQAHLFPAGLWRKGAVEALQPSAIVEDLSHAWMAGGTAAPYAGQTIPAPDKPDAYTWCKAPRYHDLVVETGALARQMVAGHPLIRALVATDGASVRARVLARLLELALVVPHMEAWAQALQPRAPWCMPFVAPEHAHACGMVEAARGALGHWVGLQHGRISGYQIIAPTTWNFSPRDAAGRPGALEQALVGLPVPDAEDPPLVIQHVVRSFDPCMVCTVH
jgi:Ni,Fe-hydrogenase I large subunit